MRMAQKQILAPRMIQSMEILQLPLMALQERIEQELRENPVLELRENDPDLPDEPTEYENPDAPTPEERELIVDAEHGTEDFERLLRLDEELPDTFDERPRLSNSRLEEESDRKHDAMANMAARPESLQDHLLAQLGWFDLDPPAREAAERIIYSLDSNGYLTTRLEDLAEPPGDPQAVAALERALRVVQQLDPAGVGARDLKECLLLQLHRDMPHYEALRVLILHHLEDLKHNRWPVIEKCAGLTAQQIRDALVELRKLNPKPGAAFDAQPAPTVIPDVYVEKTDDGQYRVYLKDDRTHNLFISPIYRRMIQAGTASEAERDWIKRRIMSAQWLIDSIQQRRQTLTRVAQAIVDHQREFLEKGPEYIEPLKMQQIADKVGVHVTTVSRAVDDKWIQTPRGIFPLRKFFVGGTRAADGEEVAWDAIRLKLQEIIDREDKTNPLSDEDLTAELARQGLPVKRRTVTKYRKLLNIPSSRQRRDWSLAQPASPATDGSVPAAPPPDAGPHRP
jgi:RNA polymerase sigma-54 factor